MEEREFRTADTLLVPSDYVRQTFRDRGFDDQQLVRHQYGFDPARFPEPTAPTADTHMPLRACFVGHGEPRKGLHHALSAWIESGVAATGELVVCGRILPAYGRVLSPLLGHRSVTTIGFTSDVGAVMRACDVLILPSVEEGSALVTYEAQASGCVLLVSEAAGAVVGIDTALVHRPGDVAALAAHLRLLDADRSRLAAMRARTLARRGQLTWEAAASRLDAIYRARVEDSG
jgi:glycosyltransferase involved in cell wall biosynthesis